MTPALTREAAHTRRRATDAAAPRRLNLVLAVGRWPDWIVAADFPGFQIDDELAGLTVPATDGR